ncbi:type II secretion system protein N [Enterobacter mori]
MDVSCVIPTLKRYGDALIVCITVLILMGVLFRTLIELAAAPSFDIGLPASPSPADDNKPPSSLSLWLFNEKNAWSPFAVSEMDIEDEQLRDAPVSRLPLKVMGVLYHRSHKKSLAIIASGPTQFSVGEGGRLQNSVASVARIFDDRVIIINQGVYEALYLEQDGRG